jgi:esterase/lipase
MFSNNGSISPKVRWRLGIFLAVVVTILIGIAMGPRPPIDETIRFDFGSVSDDVEQWVAQREAAVETVRSGAEKEIVWADPTTKQKTPLAVIYVHGFSATKWETRPLPDKVAKALGANLFLTRRTGHGQDGEALAKASLNDWINDIAEAIAVGEKLGDRIVIIGGSTGGTLAIWAASNARLINKVVGLVLISPNFQPKGFSVGLLNMPWGNYLLPMIFGDTRSWEPTNEAHGQWWTTSYPSRAVFSMAALLRAVEKIDKKALDVPAFFIFSPKDTVVEPDATRRVFAEWGGPKQEFLVENSEDPGNHVIAGDILSPGTTDQLAELIIEWVGTLKR